MFRSFLTQLIKRYPQLIDKCYVGKDKNCAISFFFQNYLPKRITHNSGTKIVLSLRCNLIKTYSHVMVSGLKIVKLLHVNEPEHNCLNDKM